MFLSLIGSNATVFNIYFWFISAVHVLWWNESADSRAAGRHQSQPHVVDGQFHDGVSERLEAAGGLEHGGVLDGCGDHLHARAEPVGGAADGGVVGFGGAGGEEHLLGAAVEEGGHLLARLRDVFGDLSAEGVHRRRVPVEVAEEGHHRLSHLGRDLRGGVVVEIDNLVHVFALKLPSLLTLRC